MSKQKQAAPTGPPTLAQPRTHSNAHAEIVAAMLHVAPIGEYDAWVNYTPKEDEGSVITDGDVYERIVATSDEVLLGWFRAGEEAARGMKGEGNDEGRISTKTL